MLPDSIRVLFRPVGVAIPTKKLQQVRPRETLHRLYGPPSPHQTNEPRAVCVCHVCGFRE